MALVVDGGRALLTEFTCGRCGAKELQAFDDNSRGFLNALHTQPVPAGWRVEMSGIPLLCPTCHEAFKRFMGPTAPDVHHCLCCGYEIPDGATECPYCLVSLKEDK